MNEMINALRYDRMLEFRERYRNVDVLLVDDIQFIAGKEGTQNEFFHTFNALYDAQKQIVHQQRLARRTRSPRSRSACARASSGASSPTSSRPISRPRSPFCEKKAEAEAVPLPDNVAIYIAGKIKSNIRELEGSLIRLVAYASLTGREISPGAGAGRPAQRLRPRRARRSRSRSSRSSSPTTTSSSSNELKSRNNSKSVALPRQVAMYLCKTLTHASLPEIGKAFGGKHHSTVIHSIQKIEGMKERDAEFSALLQNLLANFQ